MPAGSSGSKTPTTRRPRPCTACDEAERQRGPAVADDQRVVLLVERDGRFDHDLPDPCPTMVSEVAVQLFDPRFGREHERDGRFHVGHRAVGSRSPDPPTRSNGWGAVPAAGRAPVVRLIETSPSAMAAARSWDCAAETATVTVNGLADSPMPPRPARVDREHLRVGHDDRDFAGPREEHVDAVSGGEATTDRPRRIDRNAHRPQAVTRRSGSQRSPNHQLARGDGRRRHPPADRGRGRGRAPRWRGARSPSSPLRTGSPPARPSRRRGSRGPPRGPARCRRALAARRRRAPPPPTRR